MKSLKVLVVDDSFTMRLLISDLLNSDPEIEVIEAVRTGEEAIQKIPLLNPDCITLDLMMPGMDGLDTLKNIMKKFPTPTIIISSYSKRDADITFRCLAHGAVSFIPKPSFELSYSIESIRNKIIEEVKVTRQIKNFKDKYYLIQEENLNASLHFNSSNRKIIAIGASTGGPQSLEMLLGLLPANLSAPVIVAQHMPSGIFLKSFVDRLSQKTWMDVKIAEHNDKIQQGCIYCLPTACKIRVKNKLEKAVFEIEEHISDDITKNTPSIDDLMTQVADIYGSRSIGVILSGMGQDGLQGMKSIKSQGGITLVQDEEALLFGMPKAVIENGLADEVLPVQSIAKKIQGLAV